MNITTSTEFNEFLDAAIKSCRDTLKGKANEYATDDDRFYNFKRAGEIKRETPEKALWGMYLKHLVSVIDIGERIEDELCLPPEAYAEKLKDSINYHFLLWGLLRERSCLDSGQSF